MSVKITDICIACGACIDECPVEAIVDDDDNPNDDGCYFVHSEKCVECVGHNDEPACASACFNRHYFSLKFILDNEYILNFIKWSFKNKIILD